MKSLPAQRLKPHYYQPIEDQLQELFYDLLFRPLILVVNEITAQMSSAAHGVLNATENALQLALRKGKIQYGSGVFSGEFSSDIVKVLRAIGAGWDNRSKVYRLEPSKVPGWVKAEAAAYAQTAKGAHEKLKKTLDEIQQNLSLTLEKKQIRAHKTMREIQSDFRDVAHEIRIPPELSEDSANRLAADYNQNMKLYINDFSKKMIGDLRETVDKNAEAGYRFDELIEGFKKKYSVTQNKAKFLARQETALFMSKYRRERFGEAGVTHYKWSTSHDERVRPTPGTTGIARQDNHRVLDGRIFAYSDPPVVDTATGRRANPGEDFNCRCVDIPILERVMANV